MRESGERKRQKRINLAIEARRELARMNPERAPEIGGHDPYNPVGSELGSSALSANLQIEPVPGDGEGSPLDRPYSRAA